MRLPLPVLWSVSVTVLIAMTVACTVADQSTQTSTEPSASLAILPLEILTNDPVGVELAESAFEKTLSTLASINGVRLLGPETTSPYAGSDLSSDDIDVILEELGAVAVLKPVVRGQGPTISYHFSLHWPNEMRGYLALLAFDQQITIQGDDGEPMTVDTMLEMELSRLVNTIQAL